MPIESANGIWDLNRLYPVGASDQGLSSDNHLRLIKGAILDTFVNISAGVLVSAEELNYLDGLDENIAERIDLFSASMSVIDVRISDISLSLSAINNTLDENTNNISVLNERMAYALPAYGAHIDASGTIISSPVGWSTEVSSTGTIRVNHNKNYEDESNVFYTFTSGQPPTFIAYAHFSDHVTLSIRLISGTKAYSPFYMKIVETS